MSEHFWIPIAYPVEVKYSGAREYVRFAAIETMPVAVHEIEAADDPVCTMIADNEGPVSWYAAEGKYFRTLVAHDGGQMTMETLTDLTTRKAAISCVTNTIFGPENRSDQPGAYDNTFEPEIAAALLFDDILKGAHPYRDAGSPLKAKDIRHADKDRVFAAALERIKGIRRIGDLPVIEAALPTFALRIMPMLPMIDIIPHVSTSTFVGHCITIPFGIGELDLARRCSASLRDDPQIRNAGYAYEFADRSDRLTMAAPAIAEHADHGHQDYLFVKNMALALYTMMKWDKFENIPFAAMHAYTGSRAAAVAYEKGDAEPVADMMTAFRKAEPTGFQTFDIACAAAKAVADIRAEFNSGYIEELAGLNP